MKKNVEVEIDISGEDMAKELWRFDAIEQARFLLELARIYRFGLSDFLMQLEYLSDEMKNSYETSEKDLIISALETVLEYIRSDKLPEKEVKASLDVSRPHGGEWIFDEAFTEFGNPYGAYRCSICGSHSSSKYSFCKDCGAEMKEIEE